MTGPAKVHSTDAIEAVRLALVMFVTRATDAMAELSGEMRRVQEWLDHDRPKYWKNQTRLAMDQAHEAQQALHRCLMFPIADERPTCYEERANLKRAKARLEYCQEKTERVRHWQQTMRHELFEYEGRMSQLVKLVEIEVPQAIVVLNRIVRNLEEYHAVRAADPRSSYDDVAMAKAIWTSGETESEAATPDSEESKSDQEITAIDRDTPHDIKSKT
jgi:exonuclease VII large subunit